MTLEKILEERKRLEDSKPRLPGTVGLGRNWSAQFAEPHGNLLITGGANLDMHQDSAKQLARFLALHYFGVTLEKNLTLERAKELNCCRICGGPQSAPFIYNFGNEHAHESCLSALESPTSPPAARPEIVPKPLEALHRFIAQADLSSVPVGSTITGVYIRNGFLRFDYTSPSPQNSPPAVSKQSLHAEAATVDAPKPVAGKREPFTGEDPLMLIMDKCEQYWNDHNIGSSEVHSALEWIHSRAGEATHARDYVREKPASGDAKPRLHDPTDVICASVDEELALAERTVEALTKENEEIIKELSAARAALEAMTKERDNLLQDHHSLCWDVELAHESISAKEAALEAMRAENERLRAGAEKLNVELNQLEADRDAMKQSRDDWRKVADDRYREIKRTASLSALPANGLDPTKVYILHGGQCYQTANRDEIYQHPKTEQLYLTASAGVVECGIEEYLKERVILSAPIPLSPPSEKGITFNELQEAVNGCELIAVANDDAVAKYLADELGIAPSAGGTK